MSDEAVLRRIESLENDNARLRRLLERGGSTAGLRHQVRNTLAMVRDVIRSSAERCEGAEDYAGHLEARLDAVFRIQTAIANALPDGVALDMLVMGEMLAHATREGEQLSVTGPIVLLQPSAAATLALALHELAANAVKFGALTALEGWVTVSWTVEVGDDGQSWLVLHWIESGVSGLPPALPRRGFGAEMVESAIRYQLGGQGELSIGPGGIRCMIRLPLTRWIGSLSDAEKSDVE